MLSNCLIRLNLSEICGTNPNKETLIPESEFHTCGRCQQLFDRTDILTHICYSNNTKLNPINVYIQNQYTKATFFNSYWIRAEFRSSFFI